jgi:dienelactone hydrolase
MPERVEGYETPCDFSAGGITHPVYRAGQGKPVVVLHELPGLSKGCLALGLNLAQHFRVHMPLLFGKPGQSAPLRAIREICIQREIYLFAAHERAPILDWLRDLCRDAKSRAERDETGEIKGVGVIGMCLTGGFALALVADESVIAPVVAQPSLPLLIHRAKLGLRKEDLDAAKARTQTKAFGPRSVLGLRYARDCISPRRRINAIKTEFEEAYDYQQIPGCGHSTLTDNPQSQSHALTRTIAFLKARL